MSRHKFNSECETCQEKRTENKRIAALERENAELRAALTEAREMVESWGGYASDYFKGKWNLAGDLAKIDAALAAK